jgi:hypothetical protein
MKFTPINVSFIGIFILAFSLLSWTVSKSLEYDLQPENIYSTSYKNVEKNYEKIQNDEKLFNKKIYFDYEVKTIQNKKQIHVFLESKDNKYHKFDVKALLTRPHTNKNNKELKSIFSSKSTKTNKQYIIPLPKLSKGRWRVIVEIKTDNVKIYKHISIKEK